MVSNIKILINNSIGRIYLIALLLGLSMGIINPLASTHMTQNGINDIWIGAISSTYFCFMAIGSVFIDKKLRGKNIKLIITVGLLITSVSSIFFPVSNSVLIWFVLMACMGSGIGFAMVGIQTAMHKITDETNKALVSGLYAFLFAIGFVISSVIGPIIYDKYNWVAFIISTIAILISVIVINIETDNLFDINKGVKTKVFSKIQIGLIGAFSYGFSETTLVSLYPLFLLNSNFKLSQIGFALGIFIIGSIAGTLPITYMADKVGREKCLGISILVSLFAIIGITIFDDFIAKLVFSFLGGFTIGPVYPLSMSISVQNLKKDEIISGTSLFTFSYGIGSTVGPFSSSITMHLFGNKYIFSISFFIFIILAIYIFRNVSTVNTNTLSYSKLKE